jgi:hypothetical protein
MKCRECNTYLHEGGHRIFCDLAEILKKHKFEVCYRETQEEYDNAVIAYSKEQAKRRFEWRRAYYNSNVNKYWTD